MVNPRAAGVSVRTRRAGGYKYYPSPQVIFRTKRRRETGTGDDRSSQHKLFNACLIFLFFGHIQVRPKVSVLYFVNFGL